MPAVGLHARPAVTALSGVHDTASKEGRHSGLALHKNLR